MASLMRPGPAALFAALLITLPAAAAQAPTTGLSLTATPSGGWDSDGFLEAGVEAATWSVNATVTFSNTAACAQDTTLTLEAIDLAGRTASRGATPATSPIAVPAGGGSRSVEGTARFELAATARGGEAVTVRLHGVVAACPSPIGTQVKAEANATLTAKALLRPAIEVDYENRSGAGVFNFTVRNVGNGALLIGASVEPVEGAPQQASNPPAGLSLEPGEFTVFTLVFPEKRPGRYEVTVIGSFNGPDPDDHARSEFKARIEVPPPVLVRETKKAPGTDAFGALALAALAVALARRRA